MSRSTWLVTTGLLAALVGCADQSPPTAPPLGTRGLQSSGAPPGQQERMERLARRFALALGDPAFRAQVRASMEQSRFPEHKLYFQGYLAAANRRVLQDMARGSGASEAEIDADAANSVALELYIPVREHRLQWAGDGKILVATAFADGDVPVAFDTRGNRYELDPAKPPATPVIAIEPVETDFSRAPGDPAPATCTDCIPPPSGGGGGGGPGGTPPAPGLYMSYSHVTQLFEGWLKGDPEFEVHILGQSGQTDSLKSYQCAGEHAGGPYVYDQNSNTWTGNVLLFSQTQLDSYKAQHPGQSIRVFMVEDDDTACDIRSTTGTFEAILQVVDAAYQAYTGGRDTTVGVSKYLDQARSFQKLLSKLAHLILTNDEMVGNAIEDSVIGQYYAGANWIIKGENNVTTGWIKLDMR
ncbi:MAG TPA: hypothetical protein VGP80_04135 [Gemmatimonadales bacterium]|nr:hypothetical protein [Gemmatimonadales bacterium]